MSYSYEDYTEVATVLWGQAGEYAATEFQRLNQELFAGELPPLRILINMVPYGNCLGFTMKGASEWLQWPRITLAPEIFNGSKRTPGGLLRVADTLVHEMVHAVLMLRGECPAHNDAPWCKAITDLSPRVLGRQITARPVRPRRVPNPERTHDPKAAKTVVVRRPDAGALSQDQLAGWPATLRAPGYYDGQPRITAPTA